MRAGVVVIGLVCVAGAFGMFLPLSVTGVDQPSSVANPEMPASLDNLYPPQSPAPAYLVAMHQLATPLSATMADAMEGDIPNARTNFELFKSKYTEVANMVPEWKERFPLEPVKQLGVALTGGDQTAVIPAADAVGAVCHNCHVTYMVPAQHKYRWAAFTDVVVTDPLSGQKVDCAKLMMMMETNFTGIANDVAQMQKEAALRQFAGFSARFQAMSEGCMVCHDSERRYYVNEEVTDLIAKLQIELTKPEPSMATVGPLMQAIGEESCDGCHLVHVPAAYAQQLTRSH